MQGMTLSCMILPLSQQGKEEDRQNMENVFHQRSILHFPTRRLVIITWDTQSCFKCFETAYSATVQLFMKVVKWCCFKILQHNFKYDIIDNVLNSMNM